jgi:SAM-dependent methyltransferase
MTSGLWLHEIAESTHRILNALSAEKLLLVGSVAGLDEHQRVLDLCCGKGEALARWAAEYGCGGHGVDASTVFLDAARARVRELGVGERVSFSHGDAEDYRTDERFAVVSCLGASWFAGGLDESLARMRTFGASSATYLLGEPFWNEPPQDALAAGWSERFHSLPGLVEHLSALGLDVVEFVAASTDDWDRYCAAQWRNLSAWLRAHPGDERAPAVRQRLTEHRARYFGGQRQRLGWGVFVLRDG